LPDSRKYAALQASPPQADSRDPAEPLPGSEVRTHLGRRTYSLCTSLERVRRAAARPAPGTRCLSARGLSHARPGQEARWPRKGKRPLACAQCWRVWPHMTATRRQSATAVVRRAAMWSPRHAASPVLTSSGRGRRSGRPGRRQRRRQLLFGLRERQVRARPRARPSAAPACLRVREAAMLCHTRRAQRGQRGAPAARGRAPSGRPGGGGERAGRAARPAGRARRGQGAAALPGPGGDAAAGRARAPRAAKAGRRGARGRGRRRPQAGARRVGHCEHGAAAQGHGGAQAGRHQRRGQADPDGRPRGRQRGDGRTGRRPAPPHPRLLRAGGPRPPRLPALPEGLERRSPCWAESWERRLPGARRRAPAPPQPGRDPGP